MWYGSDKEKLRVSQILWKNQERCKESMHCITVETSGLTFSIVQNMLANTFLKPDVLITVFSTRGTVHVSPNQTYPLPLLLTLHIPFPGHVSLVPGFALCQIVHVLNKVLHFFPLSSSSPLLSSLSYHLFKPVAFLDETVVGICQLPLEGLVFPFQMPLCSPNPFH